MTLSIANARGCICSRPYRNPDVGDRHVWLHGWLDGDYLDAAVFGIQDLFEIASGASGIDRLLAPDQEKFLYREYPARAPCPACK